MGIFNSTMDSTGTIGCGCKACQNGKPDLVDLTQDEFQPIGDVVNAPTNESNPNVFANYLTHGFWQDTGQINRSWSQNTVTYSLSSEFTFNQKAGIQMAFDLWSDIADISFSQVSSSANITIVEGDDGGAWSSSSTIGTTISSNTI